MKGIEIESFFLSEAAEQFINLDIKGPVSINDVRKMTCYNIDSIAPWLDEMDNDKEYCQILSGGLDYIANLDYESIKQLIEKHG